MTLSLSSCCHQRSGNDCPVEELLEAGLWEEVLEAGLWEELLEAELLDVDQIWWDEMVIHVPAPTFAVNETTGGYAPLRAPHH